MSSREREVDEQIIHKIKAGQSEQFNVLVLKYQYKIMRVAMHFVSDQCEAKDICQETFIKAFQALPNFREESSFYTWLYRIAINTGKNYVSTKERKMMVKVGVVEEDFEAFMSKPEIKEETTPEQTMLKEEMEVALNNIIDELPPDLRTTITLREIGGMSYIDIAKLMHCPVGTIRSRIHRARAMINSNLDRGK